MLRCGVCGTSDTKYGLVSSRTVQPATTVKGPRGDDNEQRACGTERGLRHEEP